MTEVDVSRATQIRQLMLICRVQKNEKVKKGREAQEQVVVTKGNTAEAYF